MDRPPGSVQRLPEPDDVLLELKLKLKSETRNLKSKKVNLKAHSDLLFGNQTL
jgi:hypothetical protein